MSKTTNYLVRQIEEKDSLIQVLMDQQIEDKRIAYTQGWAALAEEQRKQTDDPSYPIGRDHVNPYASDFPFPKTLKKVELK